MERITGSAAEGDGTVETLLQSLPNQIREIMERLRLVAKSNMPDAHEFVYHHAINYKLPESSGLWICYLAAQKDYVRLGFYFGAYLSDPKGLLEGTGKRMRNTKVRTADQAETDDLTALIRNAWTNAANAVAESSPGEGKREEG